MPNIKYQQVIRASQADLFAIAQDYGVRREWDSFTRRLVFLDGAQRAAVGVRARGQAWNGLTMTVEYITVKPPAIAAMRMLRGPFFFSSFSGSWKFRNLDTNLTLVTFHYHFTTPWKWLRPIVDPILCRILAREISKRLQDLKHAAENTDILRRVTTFLSSS